MGPSIHMVGQLFSHILGQGLKKIHIQISLSKGLSDLFFIYENHGTSNNVLAMAKTLYKLWKLEYTYLHT